MPSEPAVLYAKADGIATVTMNRPEVRNAINAEMLCRLADAWQDINDDASVRALFPMGGSTVRLARQIPFAKAMEILLTGEQFSAAEALRIGLVNKVVPAAEVMREARRYAEVICENGPLAVQAVKRAVLAGLGLPTAQALEKEQEIGVPAAMSEDAKEGTKAFKEKRKPVFHGR